MSYQSPHCPLKSSMLNFDYLTTPFCFAHTMIKEINITITMQYRSSHTAGRLELGFPTGRDRATFWDKGTEISSLSRDKGTTGQAQNFATGRDGTGF